MRLTIIPSTNRVTIDGVAFTVDCSSIPATVHAVQWYGVAGEIEYNSGALDENAEVMLNEAFTDATRFQTVIDLWGIENAKPAPIPPVKPAPRVTSISRRQLLLVLLQNNFITADEAVAAASIGAMPAIVARGVNAMSAADQVAAKITWASMSQALISDPLLLGLAAANSISSDQLDAFFLEGSKL